MESIKSSYVVPTLFVSNRKLHDIWEDFDKGLECKLTLMDDPLSDVIILDDGRICFVDSFFD